MSQADIGTYETVLLAAGAVSFFWISGLMNSLISIHPTLDESRKNTLFFNSFILISLFNLIACGIIILNSYSIRSLLVDESGFRFFHYLLIYVLLNNPTSLVEHFYLVNHQYRHLIVYAFVTFFIHLGLIIIPAFLWQSIEYCVMGLVFFSAIKFIWFLILFQKNIPSKVDFSLLKSYLWISFPLIVSFLLSGSAEFVDGFIIKHYFDDDVFAVYRFGARELPFVLVAANAMSVASIPMLSDGKIESFKKLRDNSKRLMHIFFPVTVILLVTSQWFFPVIFNSDFKESHLVFNIYLLLIISRLVFPQSIATALHRTRIILLSAAIEITLNVVLSLILVKEMGIVGVAFATIIAYFIDKLFISLYLHFKMGIKPEMYIPMRWWGIYSTSLVTIYIILTYSERIF